MEQTQQMTVAETAAPARPEPGGFWIRAVARMLDWIVYFAVGVAAAVFLGICAGLYQAVTGHDVTAFVDSMEKTTFVSWIGNALGTLAYHTFGEGIGGATIGKRLAGLQVNDESQVPCTLTQAFKRSLGFFYDGLFFGLVAEGYMKDSPLKQRWGDEWAKTAVVKRRSVPLHRSTFNFLGGVAAAVFMQGTIAALTHLVEFALHGSAA